MTATELPPTITEQPTPPSPHGWNATTWKVICESTACKAANLIIERAKQLLSDVSDWLNDHPEHADINALRAACVPLPPTVNIDQLEYCRRHFAGLVWPLEMAIEAVEQALPEYQGTDPVPEPDLTDEELVEGEYELGKAKRVA